MTNARRHTEKSQRTQQLLLDAALELFNQHGTAAVSTNHIASAAGLSPGNLYYHFADKHEIIRALFARFAGGHDDIWNAGSDASENVSMLYSNVAAGMDLAWAYRFFPRELLALCRADPELGAAYRATYDRRLSEWRAFADELVAQGLVRPPKPPRTLDDLSAAVWLVAEGWLPFLDSTGAPMDAEHVARGVDLILVVLEAHLTAKGRRAFAGADEPSSRGGSR